MAEKKQPAKQGEKKEKAQKIDVRKINELAVKFAFLEKIDSHDIEGLKQRFVDYYNACQLSGAPLANGACYAALGYTADEVEDFITRLYNDDPKRGEFFYCIKRACTMVRETNVNTGKINPAAGIFAQKNFDGMKDVQEVRVNSNLQPIRDLAQIQERYNEVIDIDVGKVPLPLAEKSANIANAEIVTPQDITGSKDS